MRDPDSTEKFQAQRFAAITEISTSEPPGTPPSLCTIPDSSRPPNHVSAFTEWPCPRHAVKAPASSFLTSIGMSWMMCAQMTQGKASLFARVHKITRSSPHLQHSSFYHSPPTSTTKLLRSSSDTMARFSPQQSRPVHATPFMNHSTAPSYVLATFMRETKNKKKKIEALYWFNIVQPCSIGLFNDPLPSAYPLTLCFVYFI